MKRPRRLSHHTATHLTKTDSLLCADASVGAEHRAVNKAQTPAMEVLRYHCLFQFFTFKLNRQNR